MTTSPDGGRATLARESAAERPSTFERLASWSYRRRWWAVLAWVAVLIAVTAASQVFGDDYYNHTSLPGTESQEARDLLEQSAPGQAGDTVDIVVQAPDGARDPAIRERVERMLAEVRELPHVADVRSPYDDAAAISSGDGEIAYATVTLDGTSADVPLGDIRTMIDTAQEAGGDGLRVELAGESVRLAEASAGGLAEAAGIVTALVILVVMFGSLLAASLPIIIAIFAVGSTIGLVVLASHVATVADFTPYVMILVGLGVGIDYALLVFARYRSELMDGAERGDAVRRALDTAGRTVFFAGCTVIVALLGLVVLGLGALQGIAVAVALTVLTTMAATLTLLPSLLGVMGPRIERAVGRRAAKARGVEGDRWRRWTAGVQRRPWTSALVAIVAMLGLSAPALGMYLGFADAGTDSADTTGRQAYDLLADGFGPGFNGPLIVVAQGGDGGDALPDALRGTEGVAGVSPSFPAGNDLSTVVVHPDAQPQDERTQELVDRLRGDVLPALEGETSATYLVGGATAAAGDYSAAVSDRLPVFVAVVVGLSMVLLMVVFRSVLIPLKAALLNLLTVGASLGAVTMVFQNGWLGVEPGPIESFVPIMIFAIVFGLSMDYEIFLLSRMHEEWERTHDAPSAVREGLAKTARVVTVAAAIMIVVFGAFMLSPERLLKQFGLGFAVAILLDALVVRCLVLPAIMQLFGRRAWWLPEWLARRLPRVAIER